MLHRIRTRVAADGQTLVKPSVYFNPIAHPASRIPAKKRVIHTPFCIIPISGRKNDISCLDWGCTPGIQMMAVITTFDPGGMG